MPKFLDCGHQGTVRGGVIEAAKVKLGTDVAASEFYNVTWPQVLKTRQYLWVHYRILIHSSTKQPSQHEGVCGGNSWAALRLSLGYPTDPVARAPYHRFVCSNEATEKKYDLYWKDSTKKGWTRPGRELQSLLSEIFRELAFWRFLLKS